MTGVNSLHTGTHKQEIERQGFSVENNPVGFYKNNSYDEKEKEETKNTILGRPDLQKK